jgi:Mycobacterium membrane protein
MTIDVSITIFDHTPIGVPPCVPCSALVRLATRRTAIVAVSRGRRMVNRLWVQMVTLVVVVVAGFAINSFHGIFGSQDRTKSSGNKFVIAQFNPKNIKYEVFGEFGGWGRVSYWNVDSKPVEVNLSALPWSHIETTTMTTATADITAQAAGGNIGCRITIDDQVRSEHTATGDHAGVWCQVLSA